MSSLVGIDESGAVVEAYHGTSRANAANILVTRFQPSSGEKQWFGEGVYFFEASREFAYNWALVVKHIPARDIAVLRATIRLGRCLDLHVPAHAEIVAKYFDKAENKIYKERLTDHGKPIIVRESTVIELIGRDAQIETVRGGYALQSTPIFPGSKFKKGQQIIICVRNLDNILDVRPA